MSRSPVSPLSGGGATQHAEGSKSDWSSSLSPRSWAHASFHHVGKAAGDTLGIPGQMWCGTLLPPLKGGGSRSAL